MREPRIRQFLGGGVGERMRKWITALLLASSLLTIDLNSQTEKPGNYSELTWSVGRQVVRVPKGTKIDMAFMASVSSEKNRVGDLIQLAVVHNVMVDDLVVIPAAESAVAALSALTKRGHKGRPGEIAVSLSGVHVVTGESIRVQAYLQQTGEDHQTEATANAVTYALMTLGFGTPVAPLFLLERGGPAEIPAGTRLTAETAEDLTLDATMLRMAQPHPSADFATIYVFQGVYVTCGSAMLPFEGQNSFVRVEVPPGRYWFHAGAKLKTAVLLPRAFLYGLTLGATGFPNPSVKHVLRRPLREFFMLDAEPSQVYYLDATSSGSKGTAQRVFLLDEASGESRTESAMPFFSLRNLPLSTIRQMQRRPTSNH